MIITIAVLTIVTNGKAEKEIQVQDKECSILELEKKDHPKDNQHHIVGLEEECKKIDWYYEAIANEIMAGRSINWGFLYNTGLFGYIYEETVNLDSDIKEKLIPYNKLKAEQTVESVLQRGIGIYNLYAFQNEIDIISCRFQDKPACYEVWDAIVARYALNLQVASPFDDKY